MRFGKNKRKLNISIESNQQDQQLIIFVFGFYDVYRCWRIGAIFPFFPDMHHGIQCCHQVFCRTIRKNDLQFGFIHNKWNRTNTKFLILSPASDQRRTKRTLAQTICIYTFNVHRLYFHIQSHPYDEFVLHSSLWYSITISLWPVAHIVITWFSSKNWTHLRVCVNCIYFRRSKRTTDFPFFATLPMHTTIHDHNERGGRHRERRTHSRSSLTCT